MNRKQIRRIAAIMLALALQITILPGCSRSYEPEEGKLSIVCTIFPQYDWVRQILGDRAESFELALLLNNRIDLHSYQPTVDDIVRVSTCDLFIYVGGESDGWAYELLKGAANKDMIVINLLGVLGDSAKEEEILEGMEEEEPEDEGGYDGEIEYDEIEYDEHVWLSLRNAVVFCAAIAEALSSLDADGAEQYRNNLSAYAALLQALDIEYQAAIGEAPVKTLLFGDRFPFRYLTDDYGLTPYAAFSGCSAETEAGFDTIVFLANKVDELGLKTVMVTESADQSIAATIINNTEYKNQRILVLDAMQSVSSSDIQNGAAYLSIMESNLNVLREALG